ncbi:MAG: nucleotidyltransferase domain-containing protein [Candidatus Humimicrobiaceae bacterium]
MLQPQLVTEIINILNKNNIEYMLTGSFVSSLQGEPRLTHDIDLIINISQNEANKITDIFSKEIFYFDSDNIIEAVKDKTQFNIIALDGSGKIDFWLLTESEFDKSRFGRRIKKSFFNLDVLISAPEDTIIEKLYWSELSGGSQKHFCDALRVFEIQYDILDREYINFWVEKLLLNEIFIKLRKEAENI